jgi:hypothetical protein
MKSFYGQYLVEALGVRYLPGASHSGHEHRSSAGAEGGSSTSALKSSGLKSVVWKVPASPPKLIFFNQDGEAALSQPGLQTLFEKILSAIKIEPTAALFLEAQGRSLMDFFTWLKQNQIVAPVVVLKADPEIRLEVRNLGPLNWVECYSLQQMEAHSKFKKPTWELLQLLMDGVK